MIKALLKKQLREVISLMFRNKKNDFPHMTKSQKAALKLHLSPVPADGVCTVFCLARLTGRTLKADC